MMVLDGTLRQIYYIVGNNPQSHNCRNHIICKKNKCSAKRLMSKT